MFVLTFSIYFDKILHVKLAREIIDELF